MDLLWIFALPFLAVAAYQDIKTKEIDDSLGYGLIAAGTAIIILTHPMPYDFVSGVISHGLFLAAALGIGFFFQGTGAWKSGDTLMFAAAAFIALPVDIYLFIAITVALLLACNVPMLFRKKGITSGVPQILLIFLIYNLMLVI